MSLENLFACNLRLVMRERRMSKAELAEEIGYSKDTVTNYLHCISLPRFKTIEFIAKALEVAPTVFFYEKPEDVMKALS